MPPKSPTPAKPKPKEKTTTTCGYELTDVRRTLRDAINIRDVRSANRWTAELVTTPGAIGSLWAAYWIAWADAQGAGSISPTIPILLRQIWDCQVEIIKEFGGDWGDFRNNPKVRADCSEMTRRLLIQPRQTPVIWPTKEMILYDISVMRDSWKTGAVPAEVDSQAILRTWQREDDSMDLRMMGGQWLHSIQRGDIRMALSAVAWTLFPTASQGLMIPLKCAERGPAVLTPKQRASPLWFWLDLGRSLLMSRGDLHRGWVTMHNAIVDAMRTHYKRWTASERLKILLAWILQIRASFLPQPTNIWQAPAITQSTVDIDQPYQEISAELSDPDSAVYGKPVETRVKVDENSKKETAARIEAKLKDADAALLAMMGMGEDDV